MISVNGGDFIIGYEHNVGKLAIYSPDGENYVLLLRKGDVVKFEKGIEKLMSRVIKE